MPEALDALVAADDQAGAERADALELARDTRLQVEVPLAGPPVRGASARALRRRRWQAPTGAPARVRAARGDVPRAIVASMPKPAWPSLASSPAGRPANSPAAATKPPAGEPLDLRELEAARGQIVLGLDARTLDVGRQGERVGRA